MGWWTARARSYTADVAAETDGHVRGTGGTRRPRLPAVAPRVTGTARAAVVTFASGQPERGGKRQCRNDRATRPCKPT